MLFLFNWLGLWGKHVGFFDIEFGAVVFAALNVVVFTIALILCIRTLKQFNAPKRGKGWRRTLPPRAWEWWTRNCGI